MAKPWSEVAASDGFKSLAPEQQDGARRQYFNDVVAPQVPTEHVDAAFEQFSTDTGLGRRELSAGIKPSTAGGGRGSVNPERAAFASGTAEKSVYRGQAGQERSSANSTPMAPDSQTGFDPLGNPTGMPDADFSASAAAPQPTDRTWREVAGDTTKSLAQGLVDFGGVLPGVVAGAIRQDYDNPWLKTANGINEVLDDQKSPGMQARKKLLQDKLKTAEGWREKLAVGGIETLTDPALLLDTSARSVPSMLAGGGIGGAAGKGVIALSDAALARTITTGSESAARLAVAARNAAPAVATAGATGTAALTQGASVASDTYDALMKLPAENFAAEPEFKALTAQFGPDKAKQILASAAANRALAVGTAFSVGSMMLPGGATIEKAFLPQSLKGAAQDAAKQVTQNFLTRPLTKGLEGGLVSKAVELNIKGTKAGLEEVIPEATEEGGGAAMQALERSRAGEQVNVSEATGEAAGQAGAAGFAMGRVSGMGHGVQASQGLAREARIKQLRDAGETGVADLLQAKHDKQTAVEAVDGELAAMPGNPEFQNAYRNLRTAGLKPAEAAGRSAVTVTFHGLAAQAGIPPKAADAALQKASSLPIDQVPGFIAKFTNALAARGLVQPFEGMADMAAGLEAARDDAIEAAMAAAYGQQDVRQAMDDVLALEQENAPVAAIANQPTTEDADVSLRPAVSALDSASDGRGGDQPGVGLDTGLGERAPADGAVYPASAPDVAARDLVSQPAASDGALNGVLRDTNPPAGTATQAQAAASQAPEVAAVDEAGLATARDAARPTDVQADGITPARTASWVIRNKETGEVMLETFDKNKVDALNTEKYEAVPIRQYLSSLNNSEQIQPPAQSERAQAAIENVAPTESELAKTPDLHQIANSESVQLGRNNIPLTEGGKPFKTKLAADTARKGQTTMRTVRVEGGFALADKTEAQLAAQDAAARRLRNPQTSPRGEAIPAHAFIAAEGGLSPFERADFGLEGNVSIGNRKLFAGVGKGLSMERATEKLIEDGYLPEGASHDQARALIKRSLSQPQYTPEGTEMMAEKQAQADFEAAQAEQDLIASIEAVSDNRFAQADELDDGIPDFDAPSNVSLEAGMRLMGFTEQEISDATANRPASPQGTGTDRRGDDARAESNPQTGDGQRAGAPGEDSGGRSRPESQGTEVSQAPSTDGVATSSPISYTLRDDGTLAVKGNPDAIRDTLKGLTRITPMAGGMMVGKTQAAQAIDLIDDKPTQAKKGFGLQDVAQNEQTAQESSDKPPVDTLKSAPEPAATRDRPEALIELRKRESVLKALITCMGG